MSMNIGAKNLRWLSFAVLGTALFAVIACGTETVTVVQTVVVEKVVTEKGDTVVQTVIVEKEVKGDTVVQTVVVEKEVKGDTVVQTVVVEKEVKGGYRPPFQ